MESYPCLCCGCVLCAMSDQLEPRRRAFVTGWLRACAGREPRVREAPGVLTLSARGVMYTPGPPRVVTDERAEAIDSWVAWRRAGGR